MDHSRQGGFYGYIAQGAVALRKGIPESDFSTVGGLHAEFLAGPNEQRLAPPEVEGVADEVVQNRTEIEEKKLKNGKLTARRTLPQGSPKTHPP